MKKILLYILIVLLFQVVTFAQGNPQKEYLKSNPDKKEFNQAHWKKIKQSMLREARGNAKDKGEDFNSNDFEDNRQNASYYEYEEESYKGEYAKNNGERASDYNVEKEDYSKGQGDNTSTAGSKENTGTYYSKERKKKETTSQRRENTTYDGKGLGTFGSIILYTVLAIFLGFIIYFLFVNISISEDGKSLKEAALEKPPVELEKSELERMLEEALANKDFRLAIRIYFIVVLKDLSEKKWIDWKKEKTNLNYLLEMRGKKQYQSFNESITIFELVWYGNYTITEADYAAIEPKYKELLKELAEN